MNEEDDQQGSAAQESIWRPLDGSAPVRPQPAAAPLSFTKPEPRPLAFPASPAQAAQAPLGGAAGDRPVFVLAGWGGRLAAYIIDNIAFGLLVSCITLPLALALGMTIEESVTFLGGGNFEPPDSVTQPALAYALLALQVLAPPTIAAVVLWRWAGQTPGKRALGIRVVLEEGTPMTFGRALQRELIAKTLILVPLTAITFGLAFLANYLWPLRDPQNRAGHDYLAKTRVVTAPKAAPPDAFGR